MPILARFLKLSYIFYSVFKHALCNLKISMLKKIFCVNTSNRPWNKIIVWWEIRRVLFNIILILFGFISIQLTSFLPSTGYFKLDAGPALAVLIIASIVIFFVCANLLYTSGWVFQLITKKSNWKLIEIITARLFILGLIIALLVTLTPLILGILNIILPEKIMIWLDQLLRSILNIQIH